MARKSRKEGRVPSGLKPKAANRYLVGFYLRLSDKELKDGNSDSIENQRALLTDFIKDKPDFCLVSVYIEIKIA